jgi:hypothetical protein
VAYTRNMASVSGGAAALDEEVTLGTVRNNVYRHQVGTGGHYA